MSQICSCCGDRLKGSKHYQVISRGAQSQEQKEKEREIDELQKNSNEEDKEKKVNDLATLKAKLHELEEKMKDIDDDELNDLLESLRADIDELENLKPDEEKQSRKASLEYLGVDTYQSVGKDGDAVVESLVTLQNQRHRKKKLKYSQSYNVLTLDQNYHESKRGDSLLQRMGSVD